MNQQKKISNHSSQIQNALSDNESPKTLFDKIWDKHIVVNQTDKTPAVIYIDTHYIHEVTSPQAFDLLRERGLLVRRADRTYATMDHATPTIKKNGKYQFNGSREKVQVKQLVDNCEEFNIPLFELGSERQGIVHVIGPELGITQPGQTIVCGDSHTSTHGAFGALAFGIGSSEVGYTLATQCIPQKKPKNFAIEINGELTESVTAKDLILAIIAKIGIGGATGHVLEFCGETVKHLSMEQRMTICNMAIEAGAKAGLIAPDKTTFDYLEGREFAPKGEAWFEAIEQWRLLYTDQDAYFDQKITVDASSVKPMLTYGTNPQQAIPINSIIPKDAPQNALDYMGFQTRQPLIGVKVDVIFIGSCTNSRISDLRQVAAVLKAKTIHSDVEMIIVPGSQQIKQQAEAEGLSKIFIEAGAQWREPGCSMCLGMNGDLVKPGKICVSTSNRNFEGRQGIGSRTLLASPVTAAFAAIFGKIVDPQDQSASVQEEVYATH